MSNFKICRYIPRSRGFRSLISSTLTSTALAGIISGGIFATSARAQEVPGQESQSQPATPSENRWHHRMPSVDRQAKHLTKALKLSDDQQAKVRSALESQRKQMEQIRSDATLSRN